MKLLIDFFPIVLFFVAYKLSGIYVATGVLRILLGSQLSLPDLVWNRLIVAWVGYCLFMSAINAYVAAYFSTDAWVDFKLWGYVFPLVFILGQGLYIARHLKEDEPAGHDGGAA